MRKGNWIGHIVRGTGPLISGFEGTVEGDKKRKRRKLKVLADIKWGVPFEDIKVQASNGDGAAPWDFCYEIL